MSPNIGAPVCVHRVCVVMASPTFLCFVKLVWITVLRGGASPTFMSCVRNVYLWDCFFLFLCWFSVSCTIVQALSFLDWYLHYHSY